MSEGLTSKDMKVFKDLLTKANNEQVQFLLRETEKEKDKRYSL